MGMNGLKAFKKIFSLICILESMQLYAYYNDFYDDSEYKTLKNDINNNLTWT